MFKIAIDGPAGAGKSSIAKLIAGRLGIEYIDTGAMYRAITLKGVRLGIDLSDEKSYSFLESTILDIENGRVLMDNEDVSTEIRSLEISEKVSLSCVVPCVREHLVKYQRQISESKSVIMDGRDIGTVVLPNAEVKVFLTATPEERARRRVLEREKAGVFKSFEDTLSEIVTRDTKDSTRKNSPLKQAEDAVLIDSTNLTMDEVVDKVISLVNERGLL